MKLLKIMIRGTEKRSHAVTPYEKKIVAYHESGHVLVAWLLEHTEALVKVTIVPRAKKSLGVTIFRPCQRLYSQQQLLDLMCVVLGGRAAEIIVFNSITAGAENDLKKVTSLAYAQLRVYGMSKVVRLMSFTEINKRRNSPYSRKLRAIVDHEANKLIDESYRRAQLVLSLNKDKLKALAEELLIHETLNYKEVNDILGPPPFPKRNLERNLKKEASSVGEASGAAELETESDTEADTKSEAESDSVETEPDSPNGCSV